MSQYAAVCYAHRYFRYTIFAGSPQICFESGIIADVIISSIEKLKEQLNEKQENHTDQLQDIQSFDDLAKYYMFPI